MKRESTHKLLKVSGGVTHYAQVSLECEDQAEEKNIIVAADAFALLKESYGPQVYEWPECAVYSSAAIRGVEYALAHAANSFDSASLRFIITRIDTSTVDTTESAVALAACHATWNVLELTPLELPRFEGRTIVFPD